jgi:hypothetical protein
MFIAAALNATSSSVGAIYFKRGLVAAQNTFRSYRAYEISCARSYKHFVPTGLGYRRLLKNQEVKPFAIHAELTQRGHRPPGR